MRGLLNRSRSNSKFAGKEKGHMPESEVTQQALEEYKLLRSEIHNYDHQIIQALAIVLGATGVIFAQGFAHSSPWIFVLPMPVLAGVYFYLVDKRFGMCLIGSYLVAHVEPRLPGAQWETRVRHFRDWSRRRETKLVPGKNPLVMEYLLFNTLMLGSAVLCTCFAKPVYWGLLPVAAAVCFLVTSTLAYRQLMGEGHSGDSYVDAWHMCCREEEISEQGNQAEGQ